MAVPTELATWHVICPPQLEANKSQISTSALVCRQLPTTRLARLVAGHETGLAKCAIILEFRSGVKRLAAGQLSFTCER
jgi:hypothetical protein